jgi:hypothetical protein
VVSWTYAFVKGATIFLWTIVWGVVGGVVALVISGGAILSMISNPGIFTSPSGIMGAFAGVFVGVLVGSLIAVIGNYATIVKVTLESVEQRSR